MLINEKKFTIVSTRNIVFKNYFFGELLKTDGKHLKKAVGVFDLTPSCVSWACRRKQEKGREGGD